MLVMPSLLVTLQAAGHTTHEGAMPALICNVPKCRSSTANGSSAFSRLAAGLSLTPLKDLAFAAGDAIRSALFGGTKTLVRLP
jgi:hypothetical protein